METETEEEYYLACFPQMVEAMNLLKADVDELQYRMEQLEKQMKEIRGQV